MSWKLSSIMVAIILVGVMVTGINYFIADYSSNYGYTPDAAYNSSFNKLTEGMGAGTELTNSVDTAGSTSTDVIGDLQRSTFGGFLKLGSNSKTIFDMLNDISVRLGLPPFLVGGIITIIGVIMAIKVIELIWKPFNPI
jgi:hypothetical protein